MVDENHLFAFNGELYNYASISKDYLGSLYPSDTHTFFDLITRGRIDKIKSSSGFYSYVLIDKKKLEVIGGRDLLGKKPLYYYINNDMAIFASEETAIRSICKNLLKVNSRTLLGYAMFKNFHFGETCFEGIQELPPGGELHFCSNSWNLKTSPSWDDYYSTPLSNLIKPSLLDIPIKKSHILDPEELIEIIQHSIELRYKCDVPVQLALSGGIDSTAIATIAQLTPHLHEKLLRAVTVQFSDDKDESVKATLIAKALSIKHKKVEFSQYNLLSLLRVAICANGAPLEHPHSLSYYALCAEVQKKGKVLITGEGADELFFGYSHYKNEFSNSFAFRPYININQYFKSNKKLFELEFNREYELRQEALSCPKRSQELEIKTHLLSLLRRNDRMSMANSVEIRAPFLDTSLIYLIAIQPKINLAKENKEFLVKSIKNRIPQFQPDSVKIGFHVPFDKWFAKNHKTKEVQSLIYSATQLLADNYGLHLKKIYLLMDV